MRFRVLAIALLSFSAIAGAQDAVRTPELPADEAVVVPATTPTAAPVVAPAAAQAVAVPSKADALLIYKQGRDLESAGKKAESFAKYRESIVVCDRELAKDPTRMDAYTVKCWNLFRLERYREVVDIGNAGLKVKFDARIVEVMGEAYYFLNDDASAVRYLQRYLDNVGEYGDRVPTAYFYMAESFVRQKRLDHADISYSLAVFREPSIARWWYRYASVSESLGEYAKAFTLYTKALTLSPSMAEAVQGQARVKTRM